MNYLLLSLVACVLSASALVAMPSQVILVRHAEKPAQGDSLSPQGFTRAEALVTYFSQPTMPFQLQQPLAVYAQSSGKGHSSTRPVQTIAPLASYWQVPLYTTYTAEQCHKLVDEISKNYTSGLVVVCWSHDNLQDIATKFGVANAPDWPGSAFDWVWVLNFTGDTLNSFQQFLQPPLPAK